MSRLVLALFGSFCLISTGCPSVQPQSVEPRLEIRESVDADGFPLRLEVDLGESDAAPPAGRMRAADHVPADDSDGFDPFDNDKRRCPPWGSAQFGSTKAAANILKNRIDTPRQTDIDPAATLEAMLRRGNDRNRWSDARAATIEGFVVEAFGTGAETCNCKATRKELTDTHLDVGATPNAPKTQRVIAEITPPWRLRHAHDDTAEWSSQTIARDFRGKRVRITGWLFYDSVHQSGAENTDPGDQGGESPNWRATAWEIHPITSIEEIP